MSLNEKNVLILAEAMMPYCSDWGSCQRVYHYSQKMISEGYAVHVICRNSSENPAGTSEVKGIRVTTPDPARVKRSGGGGIRSKLIRFGKNNPVVLAAMRRVYRFAYSEPNLFRGKESKQWAMNHLQFIKDYITKEQIGKVIISGPPFGLFYLAPTIKQMDVSVILDYRDPWNLWYEKFSLSEKYERRAIEAADLVIASTNNLAAALKQKYQKDAVYPILNGYDIAAWNEQAQQVETPPKKEKLVISYVGYILVNQPPAFRDPRLFLDAACAFLSDRDDVEINFIGVGDELSTIKAEYQEKIQFQNRVPVEEALQEVNRSDAVLVIHTAKDSSGNYIVCGKLYDYLRSGKYVLSVGDKAQCNNDLIVRYQAGMFCNNNRKDILQSLNLIYEKWKEDALQVSVPSDIETYSRDYQNTEFVKLLNSIK